MCRASQKPTAYATRRLKSNCPGKSSPSGRRTSRSSNRRGSKMSDKQTTVEVKAGGPSYLGWRGELLAELALARVPGLVVHKRTERQPADLPHDFLVVAERGFC